MVKKLKIILLKADDAKFLTVIWRAIIDHNEKVISKFQQFQK